MIFQSGTVIISSNCFKVRHKKFISASRQKKEKICKINLPLITDEKSQHQNVYLSKIGTCSELFDFVIFLLLKVALY